MALANIMMWLASTGNVILAKGFLRYLWLAQPATPGEKSNRGAAGGKCRGFTPDPTRRRCLLDLRQVQWPLEPFILGGWERRADRDLARSGLALLSHPPNGQIAKGLALCWGPGAKPLAGSRAEPSRFPTPARR